MSYIDLLIQLKNAQAVKKEAIKLPYSKFSETIAKILVDNEFIESAEKKGRGVKKILHVKLKYKNKEGAIGGIKLISKPSRKIYAGYKDIKPVRSGYGKLIVSTPQGIMTGEQAKKAKTGGEMLFKIW